MVNMWLYPSLIDFRAEVPWSFTCGICSRKENSKQCHRTKTDTCPK